ncbi:MAG: hypothetical protein WDA16_11200 [Candidatus Thermoplasmatota archaeon]
MKTIIPIAVASLLLVGMSGMAIANPPDDPESAFVLDLTPAGGHSYHIHCPHNAALSNCGMPSLWENTNGFHGLQTRAQPVSFGMAQPDSELLG